MSRQRPEPDIIDLTEEPDSPVLARPRLGSNNEFRNTARSAARSARNTARGNNAASSSSNVIDLTDADDEPIIVGSSSRPLSATERAQMELRRRRLEAEETRHHILEFAEYHNRRRHEEFVRQQHQQQHGGGHPLDFDLLEQLHQLDHFDHGASVGGGGSRAHAHEPAASFFRSLGESLGNVAHMAANMAFGSPAPPPIPHSHPNRRVRSVHRQSRSHARAQNRPVRAEQAMFGGINPLVGNLPDLNYQFNGNLNLAGDFALHMNAIHDAQIGGPRRAAYQAPGETTEGFTRSTGEDMVAVCAGCDAELAYDPDEADSKNEGEPPKKKARTRKEREEHYFWAVTTCGHVFCKTCYENRRNCIKKEGSSKAAAAAAAVPVSFVAQGKTILCAVDNCMSDVTAKKAWVGLFV